jgi:hypothetical protein
MEQHWSIPPGSRSSFAAGTPIADVRRARDEAHKRTRARLKSIEALTAEIVELVDFDEPECEDPKPDE